MYEQYSSELCVFSHKSESVDSLGRGTVQGLCRKPRLESDPHNNYGSNDMAIIGQEET